MENERVALEMHKQWNGKVEMATSKGYSNIKEALLDVQSTDYDRICGTILNDKQMLYQYTMKAKSIAVVSDGSAVLGLGNVGPFAAMPVMEGKCVNIMMR